MIETSEQNVLVSLPKPLVEALLQFRSSLGGKQAIEGPRCPRGPIQAASSSPKRAKRQGQKYAADFLGTRVTAWALPGIFAQIVDLTAEVAPEALEKLATMRARTRRYVAAGPELIHPGRRDLAVMRSKSGWWISRNIGQEDLTRALRALAQAAGLTYGADISFRHT